MTKTDLTSQNPAVAFELVGMSVRMYRAHLELVDRAVALRQEKTPDFDRSDYIRETMTLQAAIDLGVEVPFMPPILRGRGGSLADRAAAKLGMTRADFEESAIRAMAAQALAQDAIDNRPTSRNAGGSGTYKRTSVRPEALTPTGTHTATRKR
jgi:hypothetical protein